MAETSKQEVIRIIERMPDDASVDDIIYTLYVRGRVDRGLREIAEGKTVSHEEVKRSLGEWLRSAGQ